MRHLQLFPQESLNLSRAQTNLQEGEKLQAEFTLTSGFCADRRVMAMLAARNAKQ